MQRRPLLLLLTGLIAAASLAAACSDDSVKQRASTGRPPIKDTNELITDPTNPQVEVHPDPFEGMKSGETQNSALCDRAGVMEDSNENFNAMTVMLCKDGTRPKSIVELEQALGLGFKDASENGTNGSNGNPAFAFSANSSSLLARSVSAVNPRALLFSPPQGQPTRIKGFVIMGFVRGEPLVEVAAETGLGGKITFYLVKYEQACGSKCGLGDMLTAATESNWTGITVYDDEDLKNTILDCRHCHQPDGPGSTVFLRMQELEDPWTHWFRSDRPGGLTLLQDYFRAHSLDEPYAGIPGALIQKSDGRALEDFVTGQGFDQQPNKFDSKAIESEVSDSSGAQPEINTPRGQSTLWQKLYDRAASGAAIPPPYHDVKVSDPNKLQFVSDAYKAFIGGQTSTLPDIRRVFLDDALADLNFIPRPNATGKEVLVQACAQCHNSRLDQTITRAHFDVTKLGSMSAAEKKEAIRRMNLPSADRLHMPPTILRALPDDALAAAISALSN